MNEEGCCWTVYRVLLQLWWYEEQEGWGKGGGGDGELIGGFTSMTQCSWTEKIKETERKRERVVKTHIHTPTHRARESEEANKKKA